MISCLCEFYKTPVIVAARDTLWKGYEALLTGQVKKARRAQVPGGKDDVRPRAEDITSWVVFLENNHSGKSDVKFYALDLKKLPPCPHRRVQLPRNPSEYNMA